MLIEGRAVKSAQAEIVFGKMCGNPVQDDPYALLMHVIHKIHEILRCSVSGSRAVIARDLIAPGCIQRVLRYPHKFHMGIAHIIYIVCKLIRQPPVTDKAVRIGIILLP